MMSKSRSHETSVGKNCAKTGSEEEQGLVQGQQVRIRLIHTSFGMFEITEFVQKGANMQCTVPISIAMQERQTYRYYPGDRDAGTV